MGKRLKTIAYCYSHAFMMWRRRLAGIYRYARDAGWFVMAVEASELRRFLCATDVREVDGLIVEEGLVCECSFCLDDFRDKIAVYCWNEPVEGMWCVYFYCMNWYQRPDDVLFYTDVQMFDIGEDPSPLVISDEPGRNPRFVDDNHAVAYQTRVGGKEVWKKIDLDTGIKMEWHKPLQSGVPQKESTALPKDVVAVSADKSKAAFQIRTGGTVNLRFIDLKTSKTLYETKAKSASMQINGCHSPEFLPDGRHVVFVSGGIQPLADIMLVDMCSGKVRRLTDDQADNQSPSVSSDGKSIVFSSLVDGEYRIRLLSIAQYL